jgi:hypothetical protein
MIKKTICQDCHTPNTPGSKFCSNCGARLPKSTSIMCPRCQTPNPSSNFYCDKCGSRLSQEAVPPSQSQTGASQEDLPTSAKMFSLPTRKPGDTGELTADNVMDWLMSGQTESSETPPDTGKLPRLSSLTPDKRDTGDLPDWLFDSDNSEPIIDAPPDITTAHFLNLIKQIDDDERKKLSGMLSEQGLGDGGKLPGWLQEFVQPAEPSGQSAPPIPSPTPVEDDDDLDWLAKLGPTGGGSPQSPEQPAAPEEAADDLDELPDWLSELSPPKTSLLGRSAAYEEDEPPASPPEPDVDDSLDWLGQPVASGLEALAQADADSAEADETEEPLPDWLFGDKPDTDSLAQPLTEEPETAVEPDFPGWLVDSIARAQEEPAYEPAEALDAAEKSLAGWLTGFDEDEDEGEEAPAEALEVAAEKSLTDWLTGFDEDEDEADEAPADALEMAAEKSLTAWLTGFDEDEDEETTVQAEELVVEKSLTDWLTGYADDEAEEALAEAPEAEAEPEKSLTDWLTGFTDDEAEEALAEAPEAEAEPEKSLTDWLTGFTDDEAEEALAEAPEAEPEKSLTDWLTGFADDEAEEASAEVPETAVEKSLTDWLNILPVDAPETPAAAAEADDWFELDAAAEADEEAEDEFAALFGAAVEIEQADEESFAIGMTGPLPDWLDDLAVDKPEISQADQADVTSFLDELLGIQEIVPEETAVPDEPAPTELEAFDFIAEADDEEADEIGEEPDWLSELATFDPDAVVADMGETTAVAPAPDFHDEPDEQAEEMDAEAAFLAMMATSADTDAEWNAVDNILTGKIDEEEFPDWLTQFESSMADDLLAEEEELVDIELEDDLPTSDLPDWITNLRPDEKSPVERLPTVLPLEEERDLYEIPANFAEAELPEWLQETDISAAQMAALSSDRAEQTDWTEDGTADSSDELAAILAELPVASPEEDLLEAEIPDWVLNLKPPELSGAAMPVSDMKAETTGPLAGLPGAVRVEPVVAMPRTVMPPVAYAVTDEQTQQALLLRQLVREIEEPPPAAPPRMDSRGKDWLRRGVALLLLLTAVLAWFAPGLLVGSQPAPTSPAVIAAHEAVTAAAGQPVLVAFDYTPALAGELDYAAQLLLAELQDNGSLIVTTSQYAAGTAVANTLAAPFNNQSIGLLAGEAIGLRQLANCLNDNQVACNTLQGRALSADTQATLQEVALVILLTGERASLVDWVEQVGVATEIPIIAGVTQALAPVAAPYAASGQLTSVLGGLPAVIAYADAFDTSADLSQARAQLDIQGLIQFVAAILLLVGALVVGLSRPKAQARGK